MIAARAALAAGGVPVGAYFSCGDREHDAALARKIAAAFSLAAEPVAAGHCSVFVTAHRRTELADLGPLDSGN
jgi:hypothetical protein